MKDINSRRMLSLFPLRLPLAALALVLALTGLASAAELVMFRRDGCPYCERWDREIGPIYPRTEIGQRLPLRMVDIHRPGGTAVRTRDPIHYTPTFVLVENGEEVGRIEGYTGNDFFFGLLQSLVERLPARSKERAL